MRTRVIILFPLITSASVTFNERTVLHDLHRLYLNIRITLGRIANHSGERRRRERRGRNRRRERRPGSPNYTPADEELRSLASKILIGCAWILHRRPTTKEEGASRSPLSSARGSEVERCSIDSCHEAASTPRVGKILSRVSLSCSLFICRLQIESVMSADSVADLRRTA